MKLFCYVKRIGTPILFITRKNPITSDDQHKILQNMFNQSRKKLEECTDLILTQVTITHRSNKKGHNSIKKL